MVGKKILLARKRTGMSQTQLARKSGLSKQTIWKYEHGIVKNIPLENIEAIALSLGVPPNELVGWKVQIQICKAEDP